MLPLDCCLRIPPLLSSPVPFPSREQLWQNPPLHPCSSQCAYSRVNTSWLGLCETLHYREFWKTFEASPPHHLCQENVWIYILFKVYKWFHFNNILWSSLNNPMRQAIMIISILYREETESFVRLINLAKVPQLAYKTFLEWKKKEGERMRYN